MNKRHKDIAELSFILVIGDEIRKDKSKLAIIGKYERLEKAIYQELSKYSPISTGETLMIDKVITRFENESGWHVKKRDIRSYLAFFLGFSDKWPKINARLITLHKYFDKNGIPALCDISGETALECWERICDESD